MSAHEDLSRAEGVKASSERAFGLVFAAFFVLIGLFPLLRGRPMRLWAFPVAVIFLLAGLLLPAVLKPLNWFWMQLAVVLHKIMTHIVTGAMFFLIFTPIGLLMRAFGKDPLRVAYDPKSSSYWILREPPGPPPESMINQF